MTRLSEKTSSLFQHQTSRLFWALFALQVVAWTLVPALTQINPPLDVVEGFAWGREWPLGTPHHPPLQAWLLQISYGLLGTSSFGYYALSALSTALALWAIYRTGRLLVGKYEGLIAAFLAQGIFYFNFLSTEFNPNVLQLVLYALGGYAFAHALVLKKLKYWLLLGVVFAAGFYAKYSMAVLAASFGLFSLAQPEARRNYRTPSPYLALITTALLLAPHVYWVAQHDFLPFKFPLDRSEKAANLFQRLWFPVKFALSQLLDLLPALLAAACVLLPLKRRTDRESSLKKDLIVWFAFAPLVISLILSLISGQKLRDMWGSAFLNFIPLWLVSLYAIQPKRLPLFLGAWGTVFVLTLGAFAGNLLFATQLGYKPLRGHFPGRELSARLHALWHDKTQAPLHYVIGDVWEAGNVALFSTEQERPHVWIEGSPLTSPWIDPQKVKTDGAIVIWRIREKGDSPPAWLKFFPKTHLGIPFELPWYGGGAPAPVRLGWGWLSPATPR